MSRQEQESKSPLADAERWLKLAQEAKNAGMLYLLLTGGEPFLHPQFREILEGLHEMGFLITVNSNGTMIDESVIDWLKNCPPVRLNISLYGASDKTYAQLCSNPMGFTQTLGAIRLLKKAGISVKLNCSLTPHNAKDLPKMVDIAKQNDLILQVATYMFPPVRKDEALTGKNDRFSPADAAYYMAYADYLTLGKERFLAQEGQLPELFEPEENCEGDGVRCSAGKCSFWITWQGKMMPCGMFPEGNAPNVFEIPFLNAWQAVKESVCNIHLPAQCAACNVKDTCRACAAMVVTESGCFDKAPQYRCDMMRACKAQWNRLKEEML
jgi:MoaA/NifB/PqqE/SkfB family radical SAM enzyme